ncbi:hypothetical protein [Bordetella hinzii]|uniref:DUF6414 family protein n=1 Tax=Bordetella hinzii TaxID=103855 RepID=UPI00068C6AFF|nr:hypothetical protein [Bordetella hinzii]QDJ43782.1 hypothetical protein CBR70_22140 [Bordetella hinzii]
MDQDSPSIDFLYDFLYVDKPRVHSWLAQLFDEGVLKTFKHSSSTSDTSEGTVGIKAVVQGGLKHNGTVTEGQERVYDAEWSLPILLIDRLDEIGHITKDIVSARIGDLVMVAGRMELTDVQTLQKMWSPAIKLMIAEQKVTHANKQEVAKLKETLAHFGEAISAMPPDAQLYMRDRTEVAVWASLRAEHTIINTSTLALAHGAAIAGQWMMLAVLDSKPDWENPFAEGGPMINTSDMAETMHAVLNLVRKLAGRSAGAYGVTPIAIFRPVLRATPDSGPDKS